jgi:hypothetical protein
VHALEVVPGANIEGLQHSVTVAQIVTEEQGPRSLLPPTTGRGATRLVGPSISA